MSVLIRESQTGKCFVFVKGNPEMIHKYSSTKFAGFGEFIKKMSFSGYRSIGFGYKEVRAEEIDAMLNGTREEFLRNTELLGVVTFVNQLKDDAVSTI
jgi:magnesium-transporting ATPase (P-type)